ncbi:hypothetical protein FBU30_002511 [Linnemannia zychae]|nr:hypothetical protein FBU30_002511 [Linnemannia zychae]
MQAKFAAPPWDKSRASAQTAAAEVLANNSNSIKLPAILSKASESESVSSTSTKMSKIQGVFGKQIKKNKNKKSVSETVPSTTTVSSPKPLRSALVQRPMRTPSVRKVQVNGHQQQGSVSSRRIQQNEPLVNLSQDQGIASNAGSRRNSEEQSRTGPTRHRRQSSIASRQASQQGHYSPADRKQRLSLRHSSSEEYDIILHSDLYTLDSHQQQPQLQYHGGYIQYDNIAAPQTPRVNPVSTKSSSPQINDPLASISPRTSRGAAADGSFTFSPFRRRESYPSCSSRDTSPKLGAVSTPKQQQHNHTNTIASHPHRRSSYDATTSVSRRSSYETNYRRNSMIVTSSSPSVITSPVARLSVDHTFMSDHSSPSSPTLPYPQTTIPILSPHNHHALFANYQQQQQLQLQQQQQQQQQFQRQPPMQVVPDHHYQQHHHQQFMNTHAGPQVYHEQYHQPTKQQPLYQYPAYAYQYNMPQPLPSHLYYPSTQHPTLSYAGVSMSPPPPPPPPLQYSISKPSSSVSGPGGISSGGSGSNNPSPTSWSSVSPSPSPSTPTRGNRQLHFSTAQPIIHETWTPDQYDRTSDPNITAHRLTPAIAQKIKHELNTFKSQEMMVHQESRMNTHFFT